MDKRLLDILINKETGMSGQSGDDRALVDGTYGQAVIENRALMSIRLEHQPEPDMQTILDGARERREATRPMGLTNVLGRTIMRYSWQMAVGAVVLGVLIALIMWPRTVTWATIDGYVLEYTLVFHDEYTGTVEDGPDHPMAVFRRTVEEWAKEHAEAAGLPDGRRLMEIETLEYGIHLVPQGNGHSKGDGMESRLQLSLFTADDELLDSLVDALRPIEGLSDPEVYSETWYYQEKYPENYFTGRQISINGKVYTYPQDFRPDELDDLWLFKYHPPLDEIRYIAYLRIGDGRRIPLADVVKLSDNGAALVIEDYARQYEPGTGGDVAPVEASRPLSMYEQNIAQSMGSTNGVVTVNPLLDEDGEEIPRGDVEFYNSRGELVTYSDLIKLNQKPHRPVPSFLRTWDVAVSKDELDVEFDPLDLLDRKARMEGGNYWRRLESRQAIGRRYVVDLPGTYDAVVTMDGAPTANQTHRGVAEAMRLDKAAEEWCSRYPELMDGDKLGGLFEYGTIIYEGIPVQWFMTLWFTDPDLGSEIEQALGIGSAGNCRKVMVKHPFTSGLGSRRPEYNKWWWELTFRDESKLPYQLEAGVEEILSNWLTRNPAVDEQSFEFFTPEPVPGVHYVRLYTNLEHRRDFQSLIEALRTGGLTGVRIEHAYRDTYPVGTCLAYSLYGPDMLRGAGSEGFSLGIDDREQQSATIRLDRAIEALRTWMVDNEAGSGFTGSMVQVEYERVYLGDLDIGLKIKTNQPDNQVIDSLAAAMEQAGLSDPYIFKPEYYNAGKLDASEKAEIEVQQQLWFGEDVLMRCTYLAHPYSELFAPEEFPGLFTPDAIQNAFDLNDQLVNAVDKWNAEQTGDAGTRPVATVEPKYRGGVPTAAVIHCSIGSKAIGASISVLVEEAGVTDCRYGRLYYAYNHEEFITEPAPFRMRESDGPAWISIKLLPDVTIFGLSNEELEQHLAAERIAGLNETVKAMEAVVSDWMQANNLDTQLDENGMAKVSCNANPIVGIPQKFVVLIDLGGEQLNRRAVDELKVLLMAVDGARELTVMGLDE